MALPTTAQLQAAFAPIFALIDSAGEPVVIREYMSPGAYTEHPPINAKAKPVKLEDLVEGSLAKQGDFFLIVRANAFPVARKLEQRDRVTFRGRDYAVINDDANQYSIGGNSYARVLHVRG
jgi:hypothetical protein